MFFIYVESASKPSNFKSFYKIYILLLALYFIQDFICTLFVLYAGAGNKIDESKACEYTIIFL